MRSTWIFGLAARPSGESTTTIFRTQGTADSTVRLSALGTTGEIFSAVGGRVYFAAVLPEDDRELGVTDGTLEGTHVLDLARPKLSATDGTAAGTHELVQVPVQRYQYLDGFVAAGPYVFSSFWSDSRASLWASDGTEEGTREVYAVTRPWDLSFISGLTAAGEQVFFLGDDFERGRELWASDGTPEGTHLVADVMAGPWSSSPRHFAVYGGELFFNAGRPREGYELWKLPLEALEP